MGLFGCGDIRRIDIRPKSGEYREGPIQACQNSAWGGALLCPMTPFGAHGHMPHATCGAMIGPIKASQWAMDTTYELLWCIVVGIMTRDTLTRRPR